MFRRIMYNLTNILFLKRNYLNSKNALNQYFNFNLGLEQLSWTNPNARVGAFHPHSDLEARKLRFTTAFPSHRRRRMSSLIRKTTRKLSSEAVLKSCYWNCLRFRSIHAPASAPQKGAATGLYGFDHLNSPKGFRRFVDEAIER